MEVVCTSLEVEPLPWGVRSAPQREAVVSWEALRLHLVESRASLGMGGACLVKAPRSPGEQGEPSHNPMKRYCW